MPDIAIGTEVWRNNDQAFEKQLQGRSAERKIDVEMLFCASRRGFTLDLKDRDGVTATAGLKADHEPAQSPVKSTNLIVKQLSKLGNTPFTPVKVVDATEGQYFIPALALNDLRRRAVELLQQRRVEHFHPADSPLTPLPGTSEAAAVLDYRANIVNQKSEDFYKHHGTTTLERGLEQTGDYDGKALMTTKYCLRYELGCCLQGKNTFPPKADIRPSDTLVLHNNDRRFRLEFDCQECLMRIYKSAPAVR
jgi:putative protease